MHTLKCSAGLATDFADAREIKAAVGRLEKTGPAGRDTVQTAGDVVSNLAISVFAA